MAYTLFAKTEIASYTDVAALFCIVQEDDASSTFWKYQLYGNLSWEYKTNTMYHCGKYDHSSYMEFENEDRIDLHKLPNNTSYDKVKEYLDKGFFVLLPINIKMLGYTDFPYKHNVFITGYENDDFIVFDFWTPSFTWKYKRVDCKRLFESIDFSNDETVQKIYVFKYNDCVRKKYEKVPNWEELKFVYSHMWNSSQNHYYDNQKNAYGSEAYQALCEHLSAIDKFTLTDSQNIHVILDHLQFTKNNLKKLFGGHQIIIDLNSEYDELVKCANRMRITAYKYYITQKDIDKICTLFVEEITKIRKVEQKYCRYLIMENKK